MAHLKRFGIENFRVFEKETWFDFAPITILTGTNSCGKSSLNKSLLLIKENFNSKGYKLTSLDELSFNNDIKLGGFLKIANNKDKDIIYSFPHNLLLFPENDYVIKFHYSRNINSQVDDTYLSAINLFDSLGINVMNLTYNKDKGQIVYKFNFDHFISEANKLAAKAMDEYNRNKNLSDIEVAQIETDKLQLQDFVEYDDLFSYTSIGKIELNKTDYGYLNLKDSYLNIENIDCLNYSKHSKNSNFEKLYLEKNTLFQYPFLHFNNEKLYEFVALEKFIDPNSNEEHELSENNINFIKKIIQFKIVNPEFDNFDIYKHSNQIKEIENEILQHYVLYDNDDKYNRIKGIFDNLILDFHQRALFIKELNLKDLNPLTDFILNHYLIGGVEDTLATYFDVPNSIELNSNFSKILEDFIFKNILKSKHNISIANQIEYLPVARAKNERIIQFNNKESFSLDSIILDYLKKKQQK